jgi:hypothetical protein
MLMEQLYKQYFYPSAKKFYEILREHDIPATHAEVKEFIEGYNVSQVHKPVRKEKKKQLNTIASTAEDEFQIDLLDYSKFKTSNRHFSWILVAIDLFTRKGYAQPVKNKTPSSVLDAFLKLGIQPKMVVHDDGSEYKGVFQKYLEDNDIANYSINSRNHSTFGVVDRFARTIKEKIEKHFTANNTVNWVNQLNNVINAYNSTPQSGIADIAPNNAENEHDLISSINFWKAAENNDKTAKAKPKKTFKVGDIVRYKINKSQFAKGYAATYSKKVHVVEEVEGNAITLDNNKIYDASELLKVPYGSLSLRGNKQVEAEKKARSKRRLNLEGIL